MKPVSTPGADEHGLDGFYKTLSVCIRENPCPMILAIGANVTG